MVTLLVKFTKYTAIDQAGKIQLLMTAQLTTMMRVFHSTKKNKSGEVLY
jgi:hypothetical protein